MVEVEKSEINEECQEMQEKVEGRKEAKERGRGEKKGRAESRSSTPGAARWAATDVRCREVKSENLPQTNKNILTSRICVNQKCLDRHDW